MLVVPREHGAWGILLVPLVTGAAVGLLRGGSPAPLAPLTIAAMALFWLRTPLENWLGTTPLQARGAVESRLVRRATLALAVLSAASLVWLFWGWKNVDLLWIGAASAVAFVAQAAVKRIGRNARTASQMVGAAGLTSVAAAACYVATGRLDGLALCLWAANLLFAINQIHFVQVRIRGARAATLRDKLAVGRWFLVGQAILIAVLAATFPWLAALAFLPVLYRGFAWFVEKARPLAIHQLGKRELAYAIGFGVLLIAGFAFSARLPHQ